MDTISIEPVRLVVVVAEGFVGFGGWGVFEGLVMHVPLHLQAIIALHYIVGACVEVRSKRRARNGGGKGSRKRRRGRRGGVQCKIRGRRGRESERRLLVVCLLVSLLVCLLVSLIVCLVLLPAVNPLLAVVESLVTVMVAERSLGEVVQLVLDAVGSSRRSIIKKVGALVVVGRVVVGVVVE